MHLQLGLVEEANKLRFTDPPQKTELEKLLDVSEANIVQGTNLDEAFFNLNHILKFDYKNSHVWTLLGSLYELKANESEETAEFNFEKAVFCQSKAAKYEL